MVPQPRAAELPPIARSKVLAVEGKDVQWVAEHLLRHMGLADSIEIRDLGGVGRQYRQRLTDLVVSSGFRANVGWLGLVRDAEDQGPERAFQSVCDALRRLNLPVPAQMATFANSHPRTGVYILPDCSRAGMLEDLCLHAEADDPAMPCVEAFMSCAGQLTNPPKNRTKARMGAFLAARPKFIREVGRAAEAHAFDLDHAAFDPLKQFLRALCDD